MLVVEIADSNLAYDRGRKAALYAGFGITELCVIDAVKLETTVHRDPGPMGYDTIVHLPSDHRLVSTLGAALSAVLSELALH